MLLSVQGGEHYGLVVDGGGVVVDGGGGLGAEVAVAGIEVESADVVGAMSAGELHAALDASDGVEAFHNFECSPLAVKGKARWWGSEGNEGWSERRFQSGNTGMQKSEVRSQKSECRSKNAEVRPRGVLLLHFDF